MAQPGCVMAKDSEKCFKLLRRQCQGWLNQSDHAPCALMTNIHQYGGLASPYDTCIARSDCDFEVEELGQAAIASELPN